VERWLFFLLRLISGAAGLGCLIGGVRAFQAGHYGLFGGAWFMFGVFSGLYVAADHLYISKSIYWSDDLTIDAIRAIVSGSDRDYCVILRSFRVDSNVALQNTLNPLRIVGFGMPIIDIQEWIVRIASPHWRFLSWKGSVGAVRPTRVLSDADWFSHVMETIDLVSAVIIIPAATEALDMEILHVMGHAPEKAIILFPPRNANPLIYHGARQPEMAALQQRTPEEGSIFLPSRAMDGQRVYRQWPFNRANLLMALRDRKTLASRT